MKKLDNAFYAEPAETLAPKLLGKFLCVKSASGTEKYRITETEAYCGEKDTACHASKGRTKRTEIMYQKGGAAYIYLCYGIHSLLNIVTGKEGSPEAVLIRGIEGFSGPGKLTKKLGITTAQNGTDLVTSGELWLEDDGLSPAYTTTPRIGIAYAAEEDRERLWRFLIG